MTTLKNITVKEFGSASEIKEKFGTMDRLGNHTTETIVPRSKDGKKNYYKKAYAQLILHNTVESATKYCMDNGYNIIVKYI